MRWRLAGLLLTSAACSSGAGQPGADQAFEILRAAKQIQIFALEPGPSAAKPAALPEFRGYEILGQTTLTQSALVQSIADTIEEGVNASDTSIAGCFNPRHGIHAEANNRTVDFVICFQCLSMHIYIDEEFFQLRTTAAPGPGLTKIWNKAGLIVQGQ